jgi:hypothetical protein
MLESSPLHGGLPRNACYTKIVALQLVNTIRDFVSIVTLCDLFLIKFYFLHLREIIGCFVLSRSTQVKAVITVCYHAKVMKTTIELEY